MADYMTLMGADQVQSAGRAMERASSQMSDAASNMESALRQHQNFLDDWLCRFGAILKEIQESKPEISI